MVSDFIRPELSALATEDESSDSEMGFVGKAFKSIGSTFGMVILLFCLGFMFMFCNAFAKKLKAKYFGE